MGPRWWPHRVQVGVRGGSWPVAAAVIAVVELIQVRVQRGSRRHACAGACRANESSSRVPIVNCGQQQKLSITESVSNRRYKQQKSTHRREEPPTSHASSDNSSATCVATLAGHSRSVLSVAFHPTAPLLATASMDHTAKVWR